MPDKEASQPDSEIRPTLPCFPPQGICGAFAHFTKALAVAPLEPQTTKNKCKVYLLTSHFSELAWFEKTTSNKPFG